MDRSYRWKYSNKDFENGDRVYKQDLYFDFIADNPDFAPKAKRTVSGQSFIDG